MQVDLNLTEEHYHLSQLGIEFIGVSERIVLHACMSRHILLLSLFFYWHLYYANLSKPISTDLHKIADEIVYQLNDNCGF